jgi:hypothetical protein
MRAHGVHNFPDPTEASGGEGFSVSFTPGADTVTIDGTTFTGPAFSAAETACKLFGGGSAPPPISEAEKQRLVAFAECMRKHGITTFTDPTFPRTGWVLRQKVAPGRGVDLTAPAAARAVQTCNRLVPRT